MEVLKQQIEYREEERLTYKELIYWQENDIKIKEEKEIPIQLGWWLFTIKSKLYLVPTKESRDSKRIKLEIEELLLGSKEKLIPKLYKYLINWKKKQ